MKTKDRKKRDAEILGMPYGTAQTRLYRALILDLAQHVGSKAQCIYCKGWLSNPDDLAIEHIHSWRQHGADAFWDPKNIALRHKGCSKPHTPRQSKMQHIQVTVETLSGTPLRAFRSDDGRMHVAGVHGDAYQIRIKNTTSRNIEIVSTVDGRDVCSGEKGDVNARGYMIHGHNDLVIKGFRRSNKEVAQFRFSPKGGSYSAQMGSPENVGVIGFAVYKELVKPVIYKTTTYTADAPLNHQYSSSNSGVAPMSFESSTTCSTGTEYAEAGPCGITMDSMEYSRDVERGAPRSKGIHSMGDSQTRERKTSSRQDLGTLYGEKVSSSVQSVSFTRDSDTPTEVLVLGYDTLNAILSKGEMREVSQRTGNQLVEEGPSAFPQSGVASRYAQAPPGYRG